MSIAAIISIFNLTILNGVKQLEKTDFSVNDDSDVGISDVDFVSLKRKKYENNEYPADE